MLGYKTQSSDTTIAAEIHLFNLWRSWSLQQKFTHLDHSTCSARSTAWYLAKNQCDKQAKFSQVYYFCQKIGDSSGLDLTNFINSQDLTMLGVIEEALVVTSILESLGITYLIGGSVASGIWGEMRYTQDLDLLADLHMNQIDDLVQAFSPRFYISDTAVRDAIETGRSFNLIDNNTAWKIDIFVLTPDQFNQNQFRRRQILPIDEQGHTLYFASAEDTILQKLRWYYLSNKQLEQQWRDILGVLKLQKNCLDLKYLENWSHLLGVSSDLSKALAESDY